MAVNFRLRWVVWLAAMVAFRGPAAAQTTIDIRSFGASCAGWLDDGPAVQAAVNALPDSGGTVVIPCLAGVGPAGIAVESKKTVIIRGQGAGSGFRALAVTNRTVGGFGASLLVLRECADCQVRDLTFDGNGLGVNLIGLDHSSNVSIEDNRLSNVGYANAALVAIGNRKNRYVRNEITNTGKTATDGTRGMWVGNLGEGEAEVEPYIAFNTLRQISATGIVTVATSPVVTGNLVENTLGAGIKLVQPSPEGRSVIEGNSLRRNLFHGLQVEKANHVELRDNTIEENQGAGIHLWNGFEASLIRGNVIRNNVTDRTRGWQGGILVGSARDSTIENNEITDTRQGSARTQDHGILVLSAGVYNLTVRGNSISNHTVNGIHITNHPDFGGEVDGVTLVENRVTGNSGYGLQVLQSKPNSIRNIRLGRNNLDGNGKGSMNVNVPVSVADVGAPGRSSGSPMGAVRAGAGDLSPSLETDEEATCRFDTVANRSYDDMRFGFESTGGTTHQNVLEAPEEGRRYDYFVRCRGPEGDNLSDYAIDFLAVPADATLLPVANLSLWLKADSGTEADNGRVVRWLDRSGNGNHAEQPGDPNRPEWIEHGIAARPALRFDQIDDFLVVRNSPTLDLGASSFTITYLFRSDLLGGVWGHFRKGDGPFNLDGGGIEFRNQGNLIEFARGRGKGAPQRLQMKAPAGEWMEITVIYSEVSGMAQLYANGESRGSMAYEGAYADGYDLDIGRGRDGFLGADVAEVLVYDRALTESEYREVRRYLLRRYGASEESSGLAGVPEDEVPAPAAEPTPAGEPAPAAEPTPVGAPTPAQPAEDPPQGV